MLRVCQEQSQPLQELGQVNSIQRQLLLGDIYVITNLITNKTTYHNYQSQMS
jgi:hypothetical protein